MLFLIIYENEKINILKNLEMEYKQQDLLTK